jgi:hypothetical protein
MHGSVTVSRKRMPRGSRPPQVVKEPVQVYLDRGDRAILDRVSAQAGLSRAEVLRRGLRSYAAQQQGGEGPMMRFMRKMAASEWPADTPSDLGLNHDKYLCEIYMDTHEPPAPKALRRPRRAAK